MRLVALTVGGGALAHLQAAFLALFSSAGEASHQGPVSCLQASCSPSCVCGWLSFLPWARFEPERHPGAA